jgi:F-box protein 9
MASSTSAPEAEAELQRFREQWRAEVARNRNLEPGSTANEHQQQTRRHVPAHAPAGPSVARRKTIQELSEDVEPRSYHDLPDKEELLKLGVEGQNHDRNPHNEPSTALEHYERAVVKETEGQLGDSIHHYRRAFKVGLFLLFINKHTMLR